MMGGFPIPCWYVKDGYKPRVKALMLSVPSDHTLIVLKSGNLRYVKAYELALVKPDEVFKKYWRDDG